MLILDTDHLSVLQRPKTPAAVALNERLLTAPDRDIVTTVVSFEEQVRAWLNVIGRYADVSRQVTYYERLGRLADSSGDAPVEQPPRLRSSPRIARRRLVVRLSQSAFLPVLYRLAHDASTSHL
jgi:hypothetical protein